jgi:peroxin-13
MANNSAGLTGSSSTTPAGTSTSSPPPLPSVPDSLSTVANRNATNYSGGMNNRVSPYSSGYGGGYSSYSSPYSSMGSGYGSMYGGMGGMGGMYGGMGMGGMGMGMGGMYGGMGGMDPNNPASLTQSFSQSTAATFQLIENIVGAFGGFAQMLQSTYMATHSSFFGTFKSLL